MIQDRMKLMFSGPSEHVRCVFVKPGPKQVVSIDALLKNQTFLSTFYRCNSSKFVFSL